MAIKDKNGKPMMEREKVKERWTEYCSELYEITDMPGKESFLKKGGALECKHYRTISLISHIGKIVMMILKKRLDAQLKAHMADEQA